MLDYHLCWGARTVRRMGGSRGVEPPTQTPPSSGQVIGDRCRPRLQAHRRRLGCLATLCDPKNLAPGAPCRRERLAAEEARTPRGGSLAAASAAVNRAAATAAQRLVHGRRSQLQQREPDIRIRGPAGTPGCVSHLGERAGARQKELRVSSASAGLRSGRGPSGRVPHRRRRHTRALTAGRHPGAESQHARLRDAGHAPHAAGRPHSAAHGKARDWPLRTPRSPRQHSERRDPGRRSFVRVTGTAQGVRGPDQQLGSKPRPRPSAGFCRAPRCLARWPAEGSRCSSGALGASRERTRIRYVLTGRRGPRPLPSHTALDPGGSGVAVRPATPHSPARPRARRSAPCHPHKAGARWGFLPAARGARVQEQPYLPPSPRPPSSGSGRWRSL